MAACRDAGQGGYSLLELLMSLLLTAFLLLGIVQLVNAGVSASLLQDEQASLQSRLQFAAHTLSAALFEAGFTPQPWNPAYDPAAIGPASADDSVNSSDRLVVRTWSDRNCFGSLNPSKGSAGHSRFYVRESSFDLNGSGFLTRTCRYGPSPKGLVTQVRRQGLLGGVESLQLLFGEDASGDGHIDRWVRANQWSDERAVLGVRAGILLASERNVGEPVARAFELPGARFRAAGDGKLRQAVEFSWSIRSRNR